MRKFQGRDIKNKKKRKKPKEKIENDVKFVTNVRANSTSPEYN